MTIGRAVAGLACAAAALGFAASAADAAPVPSDVGLISTEEFNGNALIYGIVASPKDKCLPNRKIKLTLIKASGSEVFDVARSSDSGAWTGRGDIEEFTGVEAIHAKLAAKKVEAGGKTIKCGSDSQVYP